MIRIGFAYGFSGTPFSGSGEEEDFDAAAGALKLPAKGMCPVKRITKAANARRRNARVRQR